MSLFFAEISIFLSKYQSEYLTYMFFIVLSLLTYATSLRIHKIKTTYILLLLPIFLNSIFFLLGSQNALRQYLSSSILLLLASFLAKKPSIMTALVLTVIISLIAFGFHNSAIFVGFTLLLIYLVFRYKITLGKLVLKRGFLVIGFGLAAGLLLYILYLKTGFQSTYFESLDWGDFRMGNEIKLIFLFFYILIPKMISSLLRIKEVEHGYPNIYALYFFRTGYGLFISPFALLSNELFPRLLYFLYGIDILYISMLFAVYKTLHGKLVIAVTIILYGIMTNALNILN